MPSRMLDPTIRDPTVVYICAAHYGFSEIHDPDNGGHYPLLPDDARCNNCVRWEDLCQAWYLGSGSTPSTRCLQQAGHVGLHLIDLPGGRTAWMMDEDSEQPSDNLFLP